MTEVPPLAGVHHVTFSVADLDRSLAWYRDVLGFVPVMRLVVDGLEKAAAQRDDVLITFVAHGEAAVPGRFDERRTGLDHLSLGVTDRAALDRWAAWLDAQTVAHDGVVEGLTGQLLAFRDPDNIALELYTRS